jgi:hypothetical protein
MFLRRALPLLCLFGASLPLASASSFLVAHTYTTGALSVGAVVQDFNHDGFMDIATANPGDGISVLMGKADGTFGPATSYATSIDARGITSGDLNGDGNPDLAVTDFSSGSVSVLLGNGDGTFAAPRSIALQGFGPEGILIADLNGDGKADLAVAIHGADEPGEGSVAILLGKGTGDFQTPVYYAAGQNPMQLTAADLNADGKLDLAVADENCCATNSLAVLLGNGDGTFKAPRFSIPGEASDVVAGDLNGDGKLDLVLAGEFGGTVRVVIGNGDGTFQPAVNYTTSGSALTCVLTDLNSDQFSDILVATLGGIDILFGKGDGTFALPVTYGVGGEFVTLGDFNRDHVTDLVAGGRNFIGVAFGNDDGTIAAPRVYTAGTLIDGVALGEFSGDGNLDLALAKQPPNNTLSILLGAADGTLTQGAKFSNITAINVVAADFNGDSKLDLSVADPVSIYIYLGKGDGTFRLPKNFSTGATPRSQAVGDFNHDGHLDVATANESDNNISVLLGNGDGTFRPAVNYSAGKRPEAIVAADFNRDGNLDLAVANQDSGTLGVYLGNGDGTFQSSLITNTTASTYMASGDFNRDGKPDIAISGVPNTGVLLGNGDGTFQPQHAVATALGVIKVSDVNRDGKPDLVISDYVGDQVNVLIGNGDGTFKPAVPYSAGFILSGWLAIGDLNHDDSPDILVTDASQHASVLLNTGGTRITLTSSQNPSKLGQPVTFTATVTASIASIGTPSGKVVFKDGNAVLGISPLSGGQASFTTSTLSVGEHKITCVYSGDGNFNPHVSTVLKQIVQN